MRPNFKISDNNWRCCIINKLNKPLPLNNKVHLHTTPNNLPHLNIITADHHLQEEEDLTTLLPMDTVIRLTVPHLLTLNLQGDLHLPRKICTDHLHLDIEVLCHL